MSQQKARTSETGESRTSGRRRFLEKASLIFSSFFWPRLGFLGGEHPRKQEPAGFELFVQTGGERILGKKPLADKGLEVTVLEAEYPSGKSYSLSVRNVSRETRVIDKVGVAFAGPKGKQNRRWRVFLDHGSSGWCGVKRLDALGPDRQLQPVREQRGLKKSVKPVAFHRSDLQTVVWDAANEEAVLVGFLRQRYGKNKVDVIPTRSATDIDHMEAWQEFGFGLAPGTTQPLDVLVIAKGSDPYAMLEEFGTAVKKHQGREFNAPPVVGMMTWYGYGPAIDEELVVANSKVIAELFGGYPQKMQIFMLCDHGWQQDANWGYWEPDKNRFPHGMKWLAAQMAEAGVKLGLWYTPFCITENAPNYKDLVPLQALDREGKPRKEQGGFGTVTFFDGAKEAVQKKWENELAEMKDWEAVYWKLDFFALQTSDATRSRLGLGELYAKTWKTFRRAVGNLHLAPCSCYTNIQIGHNDSVRIAEDIGSAGHWPGAMNDYRFPMATIIGLWYKNRKFWVNDPDSIQFAKGCSLPEARVRATVVALSGGHFVLSEDLRSVDGERMEMIRRLIPPYPDPARPLDMFENPFPEGYPVFWALSLKTGFGPMTVLAVFNLTEKTKEYDITPEMVGIEGGREFLALEWWRYRWLGRFKGKFAIDVPAEDVAVIHVQPTQDVPSMISVSHHITGGYIVEDVSFDRKAGILSGVLVTKTGIRLVLFGHLPKGWSLSREASYHATVSSVGGWQSEFVTTSMRTPFALRFEKA